MCKTLDHRYHCHAPGYLGPQSGYILALPNMPVQHLPHPRNRNFRPCSGSQMLAIFQHYRILKGDDCALTVREHRIEEFLESGEQVALFLRLPEEEELSCSSVRSGS